jgi:periplasmic protein CpxP/Spy
MSLMTRTLPYLAATAAALCLSSSVFAQEQAAPNPDMHHGADHTEWRKAHQERRARFLHDVLNIRSDQEPAFQAFLTDMKPQPREHMDRAEHKDGQVEALTTPERLDRMADRMAKRTAARQAAFQHRADAVKRFYAVLGPEQKRAFDALHAMRGGGHGGRGGEGRDGGPGGGHPGWGGDHGHGEAGLAD